jgi:hypothetical protein
MSDALDELVWMEEAARAVGMHRERVRAIAIANGIAIRWGGTDKHPRLKVNVAKLREAILRQVYVPPQGQRKHRASAPVNEKLNRLVRC